MAEVRDSSTSEPEQLPEVLHLDVLVFASTASYDGTDLSSGAMSPQAVHRRHISRAHMYRASRFFHRIASRVDLPSAGDH